MIEQEKAYGSAKISRYLPTVPALRYLDCCSTAGWHHCNRSYHMRYENGVPVVLVILTINGNGWIKSGKAHWELSENTLMVIPANTPMEYGTTQENTDGFWEFYWLNLEGDNVKHLAAKLWKDGYRTHACRNISTFIPIFCRLLEVPVSEQKREPEHAYIIQDLLNKLISELLFDQNINLAAKNCADMILEYIQENYSENITLEDLKHRFFLSKNQIIRIFKKRTGYPPYEYLKRYRLTKACELLLGTSQNICEIAAQVGYHNASHFAAQFGAVYGMTPGEYRDRPL